MQGVLAYLVLCLFNYGVVYYGAWRYRIPMEPFMVIVATPLLVRVAARRRVPRRRAGSARIGRPTGSKLDLAAPPSHRRGGADLCRAVRAAVRAGATARPHAVGGRLPLDGRALGVAALATSARSAPTTS